MSVIGKALGRNNGNDNVTTNSFLPTSFSSFINASPVYTPSVNFPIKQIKPPLLLHKILNLYLHIIIVH